MHRSFVLTLLVYLGSSIGIAAVAIGQRPPDELRVLTYNIHHAEGTDGKLDVGRIGSIIRSVDPDLVLLQEVDRNVSRSGSTDQLSELAESTGLEFVFGGNLDLQGGQYGNAVLSRLPIIKSRNTSLPVLDGGEQRGLLTTQVSFMGRPLTVMATHLDHRRNDEERLASVEVINDLALKHENKPMILGGDINATRDTRVLESLRSKWTLAGPLNKTIPAAIPNRQIDYVLFRPTDAWQVVDSRVLDAPVASDHRPLLAVLRFRESSSARQERWSAREEVLSVTDSDGHVGRAESIQQWQPRRAAIQRGVETIMGRLPSISRDEPPAMKVLEEVDCGSYVRRLISYQTEPECWTPAYLCVPKRLLDEQGVKASSVLCLHPTEDTIGHKVVVGLGGKPNRQYGSELAERGLVTLSPSYPLLANYQPDLESLGWRSGTLKAVWDNLRGIDLLASLPYVDDRAFAAIGHSLGGHNAVYTAVHEPRIQVVVSSCGLDSYQDYYGGDASKWEPGKGWTQIRYMPELARYQNRLADIPFDFHELIALLAPRHVMINAPLHDSNFRHESVKALTEQARGVYALHGHANRLQVEHPDCDHDFPTATRQRAYRLIEEILPSIVNSTPVPAP